MLPNGFLELKIIHISLSLPLIGCFGAALGPLLAALGPLLGRSWPLLGPSWALLGHSWALLGRSWAALGRTWANHRCLPLQDAKNHYFYREKSLRKAKQNSVCRRKWPLLAAVGSLFGSSWAALGCSLSRSWVALGRSWAALGPVLGAFQGRPCKKALFPRGKPHRKTKHRVFLGF